MATKLGLFMHSLQFFEGGLSGHADIIIFFVLLEVTLDYNLSNHPLGGQGNERWKNPYWHPFFSPTHCFPKDQPRQKSLHEPLAPRSVLQTKIMEWHLVWRVELTCFHSSLIIASTMKKSMQASLNGLAVNTFLSQRSSFLHPSIAPESWNM